jgi:hypothetical protein
MNRLRWVLILGVVSAVLAAVGAGTASAGWRSMNVQLHQHLLACRDAVRFEFVDHPLLAGDTPDPSIVKTWRLGILSGAPGPNGPETPLRDVFQVPFVEPAPVVVDQQLTVPFGGPKDVGTTTPQLFNNYGLYTLRYSSPQPVNNALLYVFAYPDMGDRFIDQPSFDDPFVVQDCMLLDERAKPSCRIVEQGREANGAAYVVFEVRDEGGGDDPSGLARAVVTYTRNAVVSPIRFAEGTTDPVRIKVSAADPAGSFGINIDLFDTAGNTSFCDPIATVVTYDTGVPEPQTFTGIPSAESHVLVQNGTPGLRQLAVVVNRRPFMVAQLADGERRELDVASAMRPGNDNTITLVPLGRPGGSAVVVISDTR